MRAALLSTTALHTGLRGWREFDPPPPDYVGEGVFAVCANRVISSRIEQLYGDKSGLPAKEFSATYPFGLGANAVSIGLNRSISTRQFLGLD